MRSGGWGCGCRLARVLARAPSGLGRKAPKAPASGPQAGGRSCCVCCPLQRRKTPHHGRGSGRVCSGSGGVCGQVARGRGQAAIGVGRAGFPAPSACWFWFFVSGHRRSPRVAASLPQ